MERKRKNRIAKAILKRTKLENSQELKTYYNAILIQTVWAGDRIDE